MGKVAEDKYKYYEDMEIKPIFIEEDADCPSCERDDFKNIRGMKIHHKRTHNESLQGRPKICVACGNKFRDFKNVHCPECTSKVDGSGQLPGVGDIISEKLEGHEVTEETREKLSEAHMGKTLSEETREKVSQGMMGREFSIETRKKISESNKGKQPKGKDHYWWKGGRKSIRMGDNWAMKRLEVLERDGYECVDCGKTQEESKDEHGCELHVHHEINRWFIYHHPWKTIEEHANVLNKLRTVCPSCHKKIEKPSEVPEVLQHG